MSEKKRWFNASHVEQVHNIRFKAFKNKIKIVNNGGKYLLAGEFKIEISFKPDYKQTIADVIPKEITNDVLDIAKTILKEKLKDKFDFPEPQIEFVK